MKPTQQRVIKEIADTLEINADVIDIRASLDDLGADDVDKVEMIIKIENEFEIEIYDDEFFNCNTVGAIVALVESLKGK